MRFLFACAGKDVRRMVRDPVAVAFAVGLPLMIGLLIRLGMGGSGSTPTARLLVADHDSTFASNLLLGSLGQGQLADLVSARPVTEALGRRELDRGKASGLLIIPQGFGEAVLRRKPVSLTLLTNPAERILPGILEGVLGFLVDVVGIGQEMAGEVGTRILQPAPPGRATLADSTVAGISTTINRVVEKASPFLFPPAISVEAVTLKPAAAQERSLTDLFFPSLFFMGVVAAGQQLSDDFWKERAQGTLRRSVSSPRSLAVILGGKILGATALLALVSGLGMLAGRFVFGVTLHGLPLAVAWATLSGVGLLLFFTLLQLLASSQRGGGLLTIAVFFPLVMTGGSFFPFEAMPDWLARIGRLTPNGWALVRLRDILWGTATGSEMALSALVLLAGSLLLFGLSLARLRRFARG